MTDTDTRLRPERARGSRQREGEGSGWYRITNLAGNSPAQILIYSEIGFWGVTAEDFIRDLNAITGPVEIRINSGGGDVFDAYAIFNALASRPGVVTIIDSLAASAASVIAMAGEQRLMAKTSQLMIHDAWAMSDGNAGDLRHMADRLDMVSGQIAGVYADAAGGSPDDWREKMRAETWYTPAQAVEAGLITAILPAGREGAPAPALEPAGASAGDPGIRAAAAARHEPADGSHDHPHPACGPQGGGAMHAHMHEHGGDASHDHAHAHAHDHAHDHAHGGAVARGTAAGDVCAADTDSSPWDGNAAMTEASNADSPAAAFRSICAGEHNAGDPSQRQHWALPHHKHQGGPPNEGGVRNSLSRLPQTQDLKNKQAAQDHLEAHMKAISPDWEPSDSATGPAVNGEAAPVERQTIGALVKDGLTPESAVAAATGGPPASGPAPAAPQPAPPSTLPSRPGARPDTSAHARQEGSTVTTMSIEDRAARRGEIEARLTEIGTEHGDAEFPAEAQAEWDTLTAELDEHGQVLASHEQALNARRSRLAAIAARQQGEQVNGEAAGYTPPSEGEDTPPASNGHTPPRSGVRNRVPGLVTGRTDLSIYDVDDLRKRSRSVEEMAALCRDNALRAVERAVFPGSESREKAQSTVERLLARVDGEDAILARRILVTGHPLYMRAWGKAVARLSTAVLAPDEIKALSVGTGSDGGFAVPFELDPTVLLTSNGAINPLRMISRVQTITGKEYDLVTSAGVTVSRSAEASAVANNNPVLAQPTIKAERVTGFVPFSVEIEQDWNALQSEMMMLLADAKDVEESSAFTTGSGVSPAAGGIISTLGAGSVVAGTGGAGALALGDLDALENTVPPRFRSRASWMASKTIYNAYRALMTSVASSAGDQWVRPTLAAPAELRGYPAYEDSDMVATHATNDKVIILGDFGRGFIIVDRLGMSTELVPHLFDQATARPTGQRGLLAIWRNNSRVIIDNAFRLIKVA